MATAIGEAVPLMTALLIGDCSVTVQEDAEVEPEPLAT